MRRYGMKLVRLLEDIGLSLILFATVIAAALEVHHMWVGRRVLLEDLLLLFIYVETLTMVKVYWTSGKLPVRMPLYIAIVAIARYLIIDVKEMAGLKILATAVSILVVACAVIVVRWGHLKLPYADSSTLDDDVD